MSYKILAISHSVDLFADQAQIEKTLFMVPLDEDLPSIEAPHKTREIDNPFRIAEISDIQHEVVLPHNLVPEGDVRVILFPRRQLLERMAA